MRGLISSLFLTAASVVLVACGATSPFTGTSAIYSRVMTDEAGKQTPVKAFQVTNPAIFQAEHTTGKDNWAGAKLDFVQPTYLLTFNALPGQSISHTRDLSKAVPLLARELCMESPVGLIERELDWESGQRKIYIECQSVLPRFDLDDDGEVKPVRASVVREDYILRYRVVFDANGDPAGTQVQLHPNGTKTTGS